MVMDERQILEYNNICLLMKDMNISWKVDHKCMQVAFDLETNYIHVFMYGPFYYKITYFLASYFYQLSPINFWSLTFGPSINFYVTNVPTTLPSSPFSLIFRFQFYFQLHCFFAIIFSIRKTAPYLYMH